MVGGALRTTRLDRARLLARCGDAPVVVLVAPGGYGKSTLAGQIAHAAEMATVRLALTGATDLPSFAAGVSRAARRAGLSDLADAMTGFDAQDALDRFVGAMALRTDPVLVLVDDAQHLDDVAARWLSDLQRDLPRGCRLVVAARRLPTGWQARYGGDGVTIGVDDLRFDLDEVAALLARSADDPLVHAVAERTGGWAAAVAVLALSADTQTLIESDEHGTAMLRGLLADLLGDAAQRVRPLGRAPLLDREVAELLAGEGALDLVLESGLPLATRGDGWLALPDPLREALASPPAAPSVMAGVALAYARRGELATAVTWLEGEGALDELAAVLAASHWTDLETLGVASLRILIDLVGERRLERHPQLLLSAARVAETRDPALRRAWIASGRALVTPDDPTARALRAEHCRDLLEDGEVDETIAAARELLVHAPGDERVTRARALLQMGCALAISSGAAAAHDADRALSEAVTLFRLAGEARYEASARQRQAFLVSFHGGKPQLAAEQMAVALALLPAGSRDRALGLTYYCEIVDFLGRSHEAEALAREAADIGRRLGDDQVVGWAAWAGAWICAHRGDVDATHRWLDEAERHPGTWLAEYAGGEFLAIAADMLAAIGPDTGWQAYLDRFLARANGPVMDDKTESITSRIEAMYGDAEAAERILTARDGTAYAVERDRWARRLLRAVAALRRDDRALAGHLVAEALAEVQRMGVPDLPQRHEGLLVQMLQPVWPTAVDGIATDDAPVRLTLLGGFAAVRGARDVTPAPGNPATLVKVLALRGTLTNDQAVDLVWPDVDPATGRQRLRNLLNRVRAQTGEVIERRGDALVLAPSVVVDVVQFERVSAEALAADEVSRPGLARLALGAYAGELLPADAYEDWAAAPRERLRRRFLALVDLATQESLRTGELDEAVRLLDAAIAVEPFGEERYVQAAQALVVQGRTAAARDVVRRGTQVLAELGLQVGPALADLARDLSVGASTAR